jgi:hypothetical protein
VASWSRSPWGSSAGLGSVEFDAELLVAYSYARGPNAGEVVEDVE